jgi:DNA-binding FadR family transcriptional regulator
MSTAVPPVKTAVPPSYERLARQLREQIISGELLPGDQLPSETEMCERYVVSRSTIREALRVLSSQNLVVTTRGVNGGSFVVQPQPTHIAEYLRTSLGMLTAATGSINDLLEVRRQLEVPAAGLAAKRRTKAQIEAIRATMFDPTDMDLATIFESNRDFHHQLLQAAGNPVLEAVTGPIFAVLRDRIDREEVGRRFWARVDKDHREILGYLEDRDSGGAEQAQAAHLDHLRSTYNRYDRERRRGAT